MICAQAILFKSTYNLHDKIGKSKSAQDCEEQEVIFPQSWTAPQPRRDQLWFWRPSLQHSLPMCPLIPISNLKCLAYFCLSQAHMFVATDHFVHIKNSLSSPLQLGTSGIPSRKQTHTMGGFSHFYRHLSLIYPIKHIRIKALGTEMTLKHTNTILVPSTLVGNDESKLFS